MQEPRFEQAKIAVNACNTDWDLLDAIPEDSVAGHALSAKAGKDCQVAYNGYSTYGGFDVDCAVTKSTEVKEGDGEYSNRLTAPNPACFQTKL